MKGFKPPPRRPEYHPDQPNQHPDPITWMIQKQAEYYPISAKESLSHSKTKYGKGHHFYGK